MEATLKGTLNGLSARQIATRLGMNIRTIYRYRQRLYAAGLLYVEEAGFSSPPPASE